MKKDKDLMRDTICSLGSIPNFNAWISLLQPENLAFWLVFIKIKMSRAHTVFSINQNRFIFKCD